MNNANASLAYSAQPKLQTCVKSPMNTREDLSMAYTPGIAEVSKLIQTNESAMFTHTFRRQNLAVISDGSAVLGLGNIGHKASYPVMEGKAMLFKRFADIDAIPIVIGTQDSEEFIKTVELIADSFGAINLEDISAPRCFHIEEELKKRLQIPVMHDDQHGTATVVLAAILNAMELTGRTERSQIKVVISGAGAAATAVIKLLLNSGFSQIVVSDSRGLINQQRTDLNPEKQWLAEHTNPDQLAGNLQVGLSGADIIVGLSKGNILSSEDIRTMADLAIVIAMANPTPEILPDIALAGGAAVVATGRSDYDNQVNNALVFPGIFKGAMQKRAPITPVMQLAAAEAIREYHHASLAINNLLPSLLDEKVHAFIAERVALAAKTFGQQ